MQEDNKKPNFDFIMNQPGPEATEKPKRSKKPLAIFGGAVMFLLVLTVAGLLAVKKSTNVKPVQLGSTQATTVFTAVSSNNSDDAYNQFQSQTALDKTWFQENFVKPFNERFDMKNCQEQSSQYKATDTDVTLIYHCPYKDKSQGDYITLQIVVNKQSGKITKMQEVTTAS